MSSDINNPSRFQLVEPYLSIGSSKIRNRVNWQHTNDHGDFLSRLWTLFGPPQSIDFEGFSYAIQDTRTGLVFTAYSAGSGPAYGGRPGDHTSLLPVLDDFDTVLTSTALTDCEIEFPTDFGIYRTGSRNQIPFGETVQTDNIEEY